MSRKNHQMIDGRLLQIDKRFSALKEKQKAKIAEWFYEAYSKCYVDFGKIPGKQEDDIILGYVFQKIDEAQIWILDGETNEGLDQIQTDGRRGLCSSGIYQKRRTYV